MLFEQRLVGLLQLERDLPRMACLKMRHEPPRARARDTTEHAKQRRGTAPTSLKPFSSKRAMILDTRPRWTPSGLIIMKVRSRGILILLRAHTHRELQNAQRAPAPLLSSRPCLRCAAHVQQMQAGTGGLPAAGSLRARATQQLPCSDHTCFTVVEQQRTYRRFFIF